MNEDLLFSVIRESIFSVLGKLVFHFFVIRELCINLRVICELTTFAGINFHFVEILASLKPVNYTKLLDVKPAYSTHLRMED